SVGRGSVAELAIVIHAPAIDGARRRNPARVAVVAQAPGGAHRGKPHAAPHEHRARPLGRGPIAELTTAVGAPAIGGARGRDRAGVAAAGAHRSERRRCRMLGRSLLASKLDNPGRQYGERAEDVTNRERKWSHSRPLPTGTEAQQSAARRARPTDSRRTSL